MPTDEEFMKKTSSVTLRWDGEEEESINEACLSTRTSVPPQTPASRSFAPFNSQVKKEKTGKHASHFAGIPSSASARKRTAIDAFEENQAFKQAMEEQHQKDRQLYHMKKLEFNERKFEAKVRKMELEAAEREKQSAEREKQTNLLMSMVMALGGRNGITSSFSSQPGGFSQTVPNHDMFPHTSITNHTPPPSMDFLSSSSQNSVTAELDSHTEGSLMAELHSQPNDDVFS
ncbi:hypothetical protein BDQ17DRAFT_1428500 [Cyathus striatus]|nr:hypothetical protein BDQ17DRAFT_1428500 [Cyathus striatus]